MRRLFLASAYAFASRARRLATPASLGALLFSIVAALIMVRAVVLGVRMLDIAFAAMPDRAFTLRIGIGAGLMAAVTLLSGIFGVRLGLGLPIGRYLHLPFRFSVVYRCHLAWSLVGWSFVCLPLFAWMIGGLSPAPVEGVRRLAGWTGVALFVFTTNALADAVGSAVDLRFRHAWRWVLAAVIVSALWAMAPLGSAAALQRVPLRLALWWSPPGQLAALLGSSSWREAARSLVLLSAYGTGAAALAIWVARKVYLHPTVISNPASDRLGQTALVRLWHRAVAAGMRPGIAALAARELLLFSRARRLRFIWGTGLVLTLAYAFDSRGMSAVTLAVLVLFPLILLTAVFNNAFGFDRGGALGYLTLPVPLRHVLLAKGLVFIGVTAAITVAGIVPVVVSRGPAVSHAVLPFSLLFAYLLFGFLAAGNFVSLFFPQAVAPHSLFGWINPVSSLPVALVAAALLGAAPVLLWVRGGPAVFAIGVAAALVVTFGAWVWSLYAAGALLRRRSLIL